MLLSTFSSAVKQLASVPLIASPMEKKKNFNIHRFVIVLTVCIVKHQRANIQHTWGKYSTLA